MELYNLNKDMLVKLICTTQDQFQPQNMNDNELQISLVKHIEEFYKRKTKIIKEYLAKEIFEMKEIVNEIIIVYIKKNILVIKFEKFHIQIGINSISIGMFVNDKLIYKFEKYMQVTDHFLIDDFEPYKKYVNFAKSLEKDPYNKIIFFLDFYKLETV